MNWVDAEVDGVPTVWASGEGPLRAGLVFRVGRADEPFAQAGITHLLEHAILASAFPARDPGHRNGAVGPTTTTFTIRGSTDDLVDFYATVCRNLRDVPADRLDLEKTILRTEAEGRAPGVGEALARWRYGPASFGLGGYPEFGLEGLSVDDLGSWSERWFTRGNAALWIVGGPPPAALRLNLADGRRMPLPAATTALPRQPAFFNGAANGVALTAIVRRSAAAKVWTAVAGRRLWTALRHDAGLSYTVGATYEPRDGEFATMTAVADAAPDNRRALSGPFLDILIELAVHGPSGADLAAVTSSEPDPDPVEEASRHAFDLLVRPAVVESTSAEVGVADVAAVGSEMLRTALMMVPFGQAIGRAGFTEAPSTSPRRVTGRVFRRVNQPDDRRELVIADGGVSLIDGPKALTVFYSSCAGMLSYPDGARVLMAPDGIAVACEPTLWGVAPQWMEQIDVSIPADRVARQPARSYVPEPPPAPAAPQPEVRPARRLARRTLARVLVGLVVFCALAVSGSALQHYNLVALAGTWLLASGVIKFILSKLS